MRGLGLMLALNALCALAGGRLLLSAPATFELESTLQLNDAARADREVGYKLRARLDVAPLWAADADLLLQFQLHSPKLYLRGKHVNADYMAYDSVWDSYSSSTFYAHWSSGEIKTAYLDPGELPDVLNYKKALLSLFQIQMQDGEYDETDVSGPCHILYETISTEVFRKIKRGCAGDADGVVSSARRVQRYTLGAAGQLAALHAEELLLLGHAALGLKARSWHTLRRAPSAPSAPPLAAELPDALRALPPALQATALTLQPAPVGDEADDEELSAALAAGAAALAGEAAGAGGGAGEAAAALQLLPALRRANHSVALQLLQRPDMHDHLTGLCRLLGLTATRASHAAADDFLQLHAREPLLALAHDYLAALAHAPRPDDWLAAELLRLAESARAPSVRHHALLAAAAVARALPAAAAVRDALARGLARCRDAPCRARHLQALGNLRSADTADLLLTHAERAEPEPALAALLALDAAPPHALTFARLDRLQALALRPQAALEVRGAALDLLVRRRAPVPTPLARVAHELHAHGPHELRRVLWQRLAALAPAHEELRALPGRLPAALRGWDAAAHGGTSSVLVREPGWALGGWRTELQSVQLASAGLLRRGEVRLLAYDDRGNSFDALTVDVGTRGLEVFGGTSGDDSADQSQQSSESSEPSQPSEPAGTLALSVAGARLPDIPLFNGQAELLGHVWAGTASSPTPVLRALRPLLDERAAVPLLGGVWAQVSARAALALALDAQAQVSLWWRSARAALALRSALAARADASVRTAWSELRARADVRVAPRLRIGADLDFYSGVALCVRVGAAPHAEERSVALESRGGARALHVRRVRTTHTRRAGRTLALGRNNDATCRTLRAQDSDDDADTDAGGDETADVN
ncbi:hypothetical protein PYW08_004767 [Mythimna loreyi]|uniref:Uncharacterized protein n=1 Tax=Mythimna loreyi TaxID=667449 RepID=A0ACC2QF51_9NEOP|nr:hypothetical protein PYW08_004767 [Mythimna loreyi]